MAIAQKYSFLKSPVPQKTMGRLFRDSHGALDYNEAVDASDEIEDIIEAPIDKIIKNLEKHPEDLLAGVSAPEIGQGLRNLVGFYLDHRLANLPVDESEKKPDATETRNLVVGCIEALEAKGALALAKEVCASVDTELDKIVAKGRS